MNLLRPRNFLFGVLFFLSLLPINASANFTVAQYKKFIVSEPKFKDYLTGLGKGYFWASIHTSIYWERKIFCLPKNYSLDGDEILRIIDVEIRKNKYKDDMLIEPIVAWAFINKYPCN